jgi:hypothetical protein
MPAIDIPAMGHPRVGFWKQIPGLDGSWPIPLSAPLGDGVGFNLIVFRVEHSRRGGLARTQKRKNERIK